MVKIIRDEAYYRKKIEETENRRKKILDEDKKIKAEYEEWKKNQIIELLEKYLLIEKISENTLQIFEEKFKEISIQINKNSIERGEFKEESITDG